MHKVLTRPEKAASVVTPESDREQIGAELFSGQMPDDTCVSLPPLLVTNCGQARRHDEYLVKAGKLNGLIYVETIGGGDCFFDAVRDIVMKNLI